MQIQITWIQALMEKESNRDSLSTICVLYKVLQFLILQPKTAVFELYCCPNDLNALLNFVFTSQQQFNLVDLISMNAKMVLKCSFDPCFASLKFVFLEIQDQKPTTKRSLYYLSLSHSTPTTYISRINKHAAMYEWTRVRPWYCVR